MKTVAARKKRKPQDATLRNIRALKKRVAALEGKVARLAEPWIKLDRSKRGRQADIRDRRIVQ